MKRLGFLIITASCLITGAQGQSGVRDSIIPFPLVGVGYGIYLPGGDMEKRFGWNSMIGIDALYKTKKNWLFGFSGGFLFGDDIKEEGLLDAISTSNGAVIGLDGLYAELRFYERGYHAGISVGKVIPFKKPNPNSGLVIFGGPGFIQHKIRIDDIGNTVPALRDEYKKGYDHLTNGFQFREFLGYIYFSNRQLINFYGGFEFIQGFTANRRDYNFDDLEKKDENRIDLLYGFRIGWVVPLYKKKPAAYYLY
jgi:hypothetical protein